MTSTEPKSVNRWLNRTVFGIGLTSLFSDLCHETATAVLPAFLAALGASAGALGAIEGVADAVSSFAKMGSGWWSDRLAKRKPIAVAGYALTTVSVGLFALATNAWHIGLARTAGWLGRGTRGPVKKALLAGAVGREHYGKAFGFERAMDETGGLLGAIAAAFLVAHISMRSIFLWTLVPGTLATLVIAFVVKEKQRTAVKHLPLAHSLRELPEAFRKFLGGVALFGAGDFSKTMLILLATQQLTPTLGATKAAATALSLYVLHKIFYMGCSYPVGHLGDKFNKRKLLAGGYALAAVMGLLLMLAPLTLPVLAAAFELAGIYVATQDALEDALAAELVDEAHHGVGFGTLATVNGLGDFISSAVVGVLWMMFSPAVAFGYATILFVAGAVVVWRLR